jgi:putative redox protein
MAIKKAFVKQVYPDSITFAAKTDSKHWIVMDGPEEFGGSNAGIRPKELLLAAIAGCTGSDVASILVKKRILLESFELEITAEEVESHPRVFKSLHIEYIFKGKKIPAAVVERAIELSLKTYCAITAMFQKAMEVTHSYRIVESE